VNWQDFYFATISFGVIVSTAISIATFIRTGMTSRHTRATSEKIDGIASNIQKVEVASNSMKDALVAATAVASDLIGEKRGIEIGRAEAEGGRIPSKDG
jgi:hypothetical protein